MTKRPLDPFYRAMTSEQLINIFDGLYCPANRINKGKGHIKLSIARLGDKILDELKKRRVAAGLDH